MRKVLELVVSVDDTGWCVDVADRRYATADGNGIVTQQVSSNRACGAEDNAMALISTAAVLCSGSPWHLVAHAPGN